MQYCPHLVLFCGSIQVLTLKGIFQIQLLTKKAVFRSFQGLINFSSIVKHIWLHNWLPLPKTNCGKVWKKSCSLPRHKKGSLLCEPDLVSKICVYPEATLRFLSFWSSSMIYSHSVATLKHLFILKQCYNFGLLSYAVLNSLFILNHLYNFFLGKQ